MNEINSEMPEDQTAGETEPSVGNLLTSSERDQLKKAKQMYIVGVPYNNSIIFLIICNINFV